MYYNVLYVFKYILPFFQIYYCEYYEKYLEEYDRRRRTMMVAGGNETNEAANPPLEASILVDDFMNNGMTFCSIM